MCPKGDDPLTENQNYRQIKMSVIGSMSGTVGFEFLGKTAILSLTSPSSASCQTALEATALYNSVGCTVALTSPTHYDFYITFYSWPTVPVENNIHTHDGNPPLQMFHCDTSQASSGVSCTFTDVENSNIRGKCSSHEFFSYSESLLYRVCVLR